MNVQLQRNSDKGRAVCRADYATPLYPKKLELTSSTSGDRSVGMLRSRTQATEFYDDDDDDDYYYYYLPALQPCVDLGLLHGFIVL
jgi:hypothetical protein